MHKVRSVCGAKLGPIDQCALMFRLVNKQFTGRFIILQYWQRNLILGLNWQYNYRFGCNWNVNGHQYITNNKNCLCTSTASNTEPIVQNRGTHKIPPGNISVISVQAPTELKTKHIYHLNATDDL